MYRPMNERESTQGDSSIGHGPLETSSVERRDGKPVRFVRIIAVLRRVFACPPGAIMTCNTVLACLRWLSYPILLPHES